MPVCCPRPAKPEGSRDSELSLFLDCSLVHTSTQPAKPRGSAAALLSWCIYSAWVVWGKAPVAAQAQRDAPVPSACSCLRARPASELLEALGYGQTGDLAVGTLFCQLCRQRLLPGNLALRQNKHLLLGTLLSFCCLPPATAGHPTTQRPPYTFVLPAFLHWAV